MRGGPRAIPRTCSAGTPTPLSVAVAQGAPSSIVALEEALRDLGDASRRESLSDQVNCLERLEQAMRLTLDEQNQIAEARIRVARAVGQVLLATPGRSPEGNKLWQDVARVRESLLQAYLAAAATVGEEVTFAGLIRSAKARALKPLLSSDRVEWLTPPEVIEATLSVLGSIDLDPCSDARRNVPAAHHYTQGDKGLTKPWFGRVYMNPPYGRAMKAWGRKLVDAFESGAMQEAVALLPSRTDTAWFRMLRNYPRTFIKGRLTFSGHHSPAPFPSVVVYLGHRTSKFFEVFSALGDCHVGVAA